MKEESAELSKTDENGGFDEDAVDTIREGETVIVHVGFHKEYAVTVTRDDTFQHVYGALRHNDIIGKRYGTKINCNKGFVRVLRFSCELWTRTLPHRTQILYTKDIGMIVLQLDLKPGMIVAEAGLGSGSLSHAMLRAMAPDGMLYSFDLESNRLKVAQTEFSRHGYSKNVILERRDVCHDGFGKLNLLDAVFLDLPQPWMAVEAARSALKQKALCRFGSFSPCIEQVQRTCSALRSTGFCDVEVITLRLRQMHVHQVHLRKYRRRTGTQPDGPEHAGFACSEWTKVLRPICHPRRQPTHSGYLVFASKLPDLYD